MSVTSWRHCAVMTHIFYWCYKPVINLFITIRLLTDTISGFNSPMLSMVHTPDYDPSFMAKFLSN